MSNPIADYFLQNDSMITPDQHTYLTKKCTHTDKGFISVVLYENILTFETVANALWRLAQIETIDLMGLILDGETSKVLGRFYSVKYSAIPVKKENGRLWVALCDPLCPRTTADLADISGMFIEPVLARSNEILFHINNIFGQEERCHIASQFTSARMEEAYPLGKGLQAAPAVRLIDSLIETGVLNRASDIHIEPYTHNLRARYRVDGQLVEYGMVDAILLPNVISRLKVLGGLNIAEKRFPQDGHFSLVIHGEKIDFRLSTLPTIYGEKAVLRLIYNQAGRIKKDELGFFSEDMEKIDELFNRPYGAVFMTGPTGSGKSTTLNSFLEDLNNANVNIISVEDPVENPLPGVNHVNIEPAAGLDFAVALKHILRQDPDVVMVGEIRDAETADTAIRAALTGHLVLSTLHTNDAAGVIERLTDMGVAPYLTSAALNGVLSQRLVRRICLHCKEPYTLTQSEAALLQIPIQSPAFIGKGCLRCNQTGYKGRFAVYEYIIMDDDMRRRLAENPGSLAASLRQRKEAGMRVNGTRNIQEGNTTVSEIIRVLNPMS